MKPTEAEKLAEQTLNSLDGIQTAPVNAFLYTRIRNRMEMRRQTAADIVQVPYRIPVFILMLCIVINLCAWITLSSREPGNGEPRGMNSFAQEYRLTQPSYNY